MSNSQTGSTTGEGIEVREHELTPQEYHEIFSYQREIFELIALDGDEDYILKQLCKMAEQIVSDAVASIMMLDHQRTELNVWHAPSIPQDAIDALNGLQPGPNAGSCGTAMYEQKPQYVACTMTDARWEPFQSFVERFGIGACWSMPIRDDHGQIVGSFALSSFAEREPTPFHKMILEFSTHLISVVLKKRKLQSELSVLNRELEQKVEDRTRELAEANQAKGRFLANMSHEIRTPMNAVTGLTHIVLQGELTERQRDYLKKIKRASGSLLKIVNDVLDFSKIEAGQVELEQVPFSLHDELEQIADTLSVQAIEKRIELIFECAPELPLRLLGDSTRFRQILLNLIGNAVKFTPEHGEVLASFSAQYAGGEVILQCSVTDTGIGMSASQIEGLFDAFTQADTSTTREFGGTGLGLSISNQLIELMGGEIEVVSEPGRGSTFRFTLRMGYLEGQCKDYDLSAASAPVLVIDNNSKVAAVIAEQFTVSGVAATGVATLQQARQQLLDAVEDGQPFGMVLIDWMMPEQDGVEVAEWIIDHTEIPTPQLLLMHSVYCREEVQKKLQQQKVYVSGWVNKPVTRKRLSQALNGEEDVTYLQKPPQLQGMKVLLVEDNITNQIVATDILMEAGIEVVVASNGLEAVEQIAAISTFHAILMDLQMPVMDGYEATRQIRSLLHGQQIPIIAMTADVMADARTHALEAGINHFLFKPLEVEKLYQLMMQLFEQTGLELGDQQQSVVAKSNRIEEWPNRLPGLDVRVGLARVLENRQTYLRVLKAFRGQLPILMQEIDEACQQENEDQLQRSVHALKGVTANIAADEVNIQLQELEVLIKQSPSLPTVALVQLRQKVDILSQSIEMLINQNRAQLPLNIISVGKIDNCCCTDEIGQLLSMLKTQNFESEERFQSLRPCLEEMIDEDVLLQIEEHLQQFQFRAVREVLCDVLGRLE